MKKTLQKPLKTKRVKNVVLYEGGGISLPGGGCVGNPGAVSQCSCIPGLPLPKTRC